MLKVGDDSWLPINITDLGDNLSFDPAKIQLKNWWIQTGIRIRRQFTTPNWWKEHKAEVVFIMAIIGTFILYFMMWKYAPGTISKTVPNTGGIIGSVKEVVNPSNIPI